MQIRFGFFGKLYVLYAILGASSGYEIDITFAVRDITIGSIDILLICHGRATNTQMLPKETPNDPFVANFIQDLKHRLGCTQTEYTLKPCLYLPLIAKGTNVIDLAGMLIKSSIGLGELSIGLQNALGIRRVKDFLISKNLAMIGSMNPLVGEGQGLSL